MRAKNLLWVGVCLLTGLLQAEESVVKSRIVSVGMFKNGLAFVKREVQLPKAGSFRLEDVPEPVHGTFWVQSKNKVDVRVTSREVKRPLRRGQQPNFQESLSGMEVTVHFREGNIPPKNGIVEHLEDPKKIQWDRQYQSNRNYYYNPRPAGGPGIGRYLVLRTNTGRSYIDTGMIAYINAKGKAAEVKEQKPVLVLTAETLKQSPATIYLTYLTKGIAWAPSYHVNTTNPQELVITQKSIIRNELDDLTNTKMDLISGFPNIKMIRVTSPLFPGTNWSRFFQELNQRSNSSSGNQFIGQQAISYNTGSRRGGTVDLSALPFGEGADLHYQSIGRRSLKQGDSLALEIATAKSNYERIVEWIIPDTRDVNGNIIRPSNYERRENPEKYNDSPWDALRFKNPFAFPMTTGPAAIYDKERFMGQGIGFWANKGEMTVLRITKALSVRTRAVEQEEELVEGRANREVVHIGGRRFRRVLVKGTLTANNHRNEIIKVFIHRRFSGELVAAQGEYKTVLCEKGVYSVNKRRELKWTISLKPGEERILEYSYNVLVSW